MIQFSETSDYAWIISQPKKQAVLDFLDDLVDPDKTLDSNITLYYTFEWRFDRAASEYGAASQLI